MLLPPAMQASVTGLEFCQKDVAFHEAIPSGTLPCASVEAEKSTKTEQRYRLNHGIV